MKLSESAKSISCNPGDARVAIEVGVMAIVGVAGITLAVAGLVLFLDFNQRVHRAFALFLVLRAIMDGMLFISQDQEAGIRLRMYWFIAVPFAAMHFCFAYLRRHGRQQDRTPAWVTPLLILAVALTFEVLYFVDHDLFRGPPEEGPFSSFQSIRFLAYAAVAWVFAVEFRKTKATGGRRALLLASIGFALTPIYFCAFELAYAAVLGQFAWGLAEVYYSLALVFVTDALRRLMGGSSRQTRLLLSTCIASGLILAAVTILADPTTALGENTLRVLTALSALAVPICITYALVKHRLFDAELKLRFAIKGSTVAGAFLAVFFIVSQIAQNFLSTQGGLLVGGVVTGLVLFAIQPLQRLADRIAHRAVPGTGIRHGTHGERVQLYREQLEIAWGDGRLTAKERLLFAKLQERLGIAADEAAKVETEVLSVLAKPARRPSAT